MSSAEWGADLDLLQQKGTELGIRYYLYTITGKGTMVPASTQAGCCLGPERWCGHARHLLLQ